MKKLLPLLSAVLLLYPTAIQATPPTKKIDLKVLYVGGSPEFEAILSKDIPADILNASVAKRMSAFTKFLNDYFTAVTVVKAEDYTQDLSNLYDVTVMDGTPNPIVPLYQDRAKGIYLSAGYLDNDFDRPMLTIGNMGDHIGRRIGTKNDWY